LTQFRIKNRERVENCQFVMKSTFLYLFVAFSLFALACKTKFDSEKWNEKGVDWRWTDQREKMIDDLIISDTLIGMDTIQVYRLLGEPDYNTDSSRMFLVREKFTTNIDPDYIKYLNVVIENHKVENAKFTKHVKIINESFIRS
jgi:hypothetical protein